MLGMLLFRSSSTGKNIIYYVAGWSRAGGYSVLEILATWNLSLETSQ